MIVSYIFYGWWDYRFLSLIAFSSVVDYSIGLLLGQESDMRKRKFYLFISIFVNIGLLMVFKYYNFFIDSFDGVFSILGKEISSKRINVILPVGISFYTFQTLSYSIDVFRKRIEPHKNLIEFLSFVSFFPQLVAGPIERASNLLSQFCKKRVFDYQNSLNGVRQILWGLFKKVVIADNCAEIVNQIFSRYQTLSGSTLLIGAILFSFQIYGDFSGYSDIAIGSSKLLGFKLMRNFNTPYFSRNIAEFWRRWHISLSTWFRDYLYIPLGGSRGRMVTKIRNTIIIFLVSGFWHGANWTFIVWGLLHAIYFLPSMLIGYNRKYIEVVAKNKILPDIREFFQILNTFMLVTIAWIFFRAESISIALGYLSRIFSSSIVSIPTIPEHSHPLLIVLVCFTLIEWIGREKEFAIEGVSKIHYSLRWIVSYIIIFAIFAFTGQEQAFIYFQF